MVNIDELQPGDLVRHVSGVHAYVVTANYGGRATAVRTVDITNPYEWERFPSPPPPPRDQDLLLGCP